MKSISSQYKSGAAKIACIVALTGLIALPGAAWAKTVTYQAKIVCGIDPAGVVARIVPGQYLTTVGMQNPSPKKPINLSMRVALTFPPAAASGELAAPGPVSAVKTVTLSAYQALEVSCDQIMGDGVSSAFFTGLPQRPDNSPFPYIEGFLIIEANNPLAVSEGHTSAADANSPITSFSMQQIQATK